MSRHSLLFSLVGLAMAASDTASAALSIHAWNPDGGNLLIVTDSMGAPVNGILRIGFFGTDADNSANASVLSGADYSAVDTLFTPLGEGDAGLGTLSGGGFSFDVIDGNFNVNVLGISGALLPPDTQMFLWFFNHTDPALATEWALITDYSPAWKSVVDDPVLGGNIPTLLVATDTVLPSDVLRGSIVGNQLRLAPVPEPATCALAMLTTALWLRRRRVAR